VTSTATPATPYTVHLAIYDASGRLVRDLGERAVVSLGTAVLTSAPVLFADGGQSILFHDEAGNLLGAWDGLHSDGGFVSPGAYRVQAKWNGNGTGVELWSAFSVLPSGSQLARSLVVAPNPAGGPGQAFAQLRWIPDTRSALVKASIYNVAGELVMTNAVDAGAGRMAWDLRTPSQLAVADGIYVWQVTVLDAGGRAIDRKVLKLAVMRR
jgi:hypothetical protein